MDSDKERELAIILLSLAVDFSELIVFYKTLREEENDKKEQEALKQQLEQISKRINKLENIVLK